MNMAFDAVTDAPVTTPEAVRLVASAVPVSVGEPANTSAPVPVSSVTAAARLALEGVPRKVATPEPRLVIPVPPLATGRVPVTPVVSGKPVAFVRTPLVGVPSSGDTKVGEVDSTMEPVPVTLLDSGTPP